MLITERCAGAVEECLRTAPGGRRGAGARLGAGSLAALALVATSCAAAPATRPADRPLPDLPPIAGPPAFGPARPATAPVLNGPGPEAFAGDEAMVRAAAAALPPAAPAGDDAATHPTPTTGPAAATSHGATRPTTLPTGAPPTTSPADVPWPADAPPRAWWLPDEPPTREVVRAARRILAGDPFADDATLAAAVAVLVGHDWSDDNRRLVVQRVSQLPDARPTRLAREALVRGGPELVDALLRAYAWEGREYDSARAVFLRLTAVGSSATLTAALTRAIASPEAAPGNFGGLSRNARALAVQLLDHADDGPTGQPRPLPPASAAALRDLLYHASVGVADSAADALLRRRLITGAERDLLRDHVRGLLYSDRSDKVAAAARALAGAADRPIVAEAFARAMRQPEPRVQRIVLRALLDARPEAGTVVAGPVARWLAEGTGRPETREPIGPPTDRLGPSTAEDLRDAREAFDNATAFLLSLEPLPADLMPSCGAILESPARRADGEMLLAAGGPAALPTLADLYRRHAADPDPGARAAVVRVLGQPQLAGPEAEDRLLAAFADDGADAVRVVAAAGLGRARHRAPEARAALAAALGTTDLSLRAAVADALAAVGPGRDVPPGPAADLVRRGSPDQRAAGARLLAAMGTRALGECAADLARMADNVNPVLRWSAAAALGRIDAGGAYTGRAVVSAVRYQDSIGLDKLLGPSGLPNPSPAAVRVGGDRRTMLALRSLAVDHPDPGVRRTAEDVMDRLPPPGR